MATSADPISVKGSSSDFSPSSPTPDQTTTFLFNLDDFLESKNRQFVATLAPTLSYLAIIALCGVVGNTLVFVVYYKRFKPSVTRTYILAMSVCDLMTNILSLPADIVEVRFHNTFDGRWLCKGFRTVKSFLGFLSAFILVAVAFDRQRAICSPQSNPTTVKHTVIVLVVVSACALAFTLPYSVLTGPKTVAYEGTNITGVECSIDDVYSKSLFLFIYNVITGLVLIVCITLMLVSYVRIARQLWLHKKNTATIMGTGPGKDQRKASAWSSHTYTFEETSSDRTHSSSVRSQNSTKAKNPQPGTDIELAHKGVLVQRDTPEVSCAETAMNPIENPNGTSSASQDLAGNASPQTDSDLKATDRDTSTTNMNNRDFGNEAVSANVTNTTCTDAKVHNSGRKTSDANNRDQTSSRSRAIMSRLRRTASDARSFISRKRSTPRPRGSVKKIPTRTTFMMFVLTVIFIVNYLPYLLLVSVRSRLGMGPLVEGLGLNGYHIGLRSYFINSAVNPLVYSFCSARFRQECRRLFHCRGK